MRKLDIGFIGLCVIVSLPYIYGMISGNMGGFDYGTILGQLASYIIVITIPFFIIRMLVDRRNKKNKVTI